MKRLALILAATVTTAHAAILVSAQAGNYKAQMTHVYDPDSTDLDCVDSANLTVWKIDPADDEGGQTMVGQHKLCTPGALTTMASGSHVEFLVPREGDGSDGAGLYRFDPATNQLYFHDFGTRGVVIEKLEGTTLTLSTVRRQEDSRRSEGKRPDVLETYTWPLGGQPQRH